MSAMNRRNFITGSFAVGAASVLPAHAAEKKTSWDEEADVVVVGYVKAADVLPPDLLAQVHADKTGA